MTPSGAYDGPADRKRVLEKGLLLLSLGRSGLVCGSGLLLFVLLLLLSEILLGHCHNHGYR